jgi:hypothetical protein
MTNLVQGFTGNGLVGTSYTHLQVEAMQQKDLDKMEHLTVGLEDETTNKAVYPGNPNNDPPWVSFGSSSTLGLG